MAKITLTIQGDQGTGKTAVLDFITKQLRKHGVIQLHAATEIQRVESRVYNITPEQVQKLIKVAAK